MRKFVLPLFALLALPLLASEHRETATVEVVQVPVYVTRGDHTVAGLTKEDFELFVNGKRQSIDYFDVIDFTRLSAEQTRDPRQRRLYVFVFDLFNSHPFSILRAQKAALKYIEGARDSDLFAIASYRARTGLEILVPFTRDRATIRAAVERLHDVNVSDPLRLAVMDAATDGPGLHELIADPMQRYFGEELQHLAELATRLAPIEGVKHVVLLSGGHDSGLVASWNPRIAYRYPFINGGTNIRQDVMGAPTVLGGRWAFHEPGIGEKLTDLSKAYTSSGVFLDTIDIDGLSDPWSPVDNDSLYTLAAETGGTLIANRNDLVKAMSDLTALQNVAYMLSFNAPDTGKSQNSIRVSLRNNRRAELRYRPSYATTLPKASASDGLRLADILLNDIPQTGLTVNMTAASGNVDLEIPSRELIAVAGEPTVSGDALIYIYKGDAVVAFQQKSLTVDSKRADAALQGAPIHISSHFDLAPGRYTAKAIVRVNGAEAIGFAKAEFER